MELCLASLVLLIKPQEENLPNFVSIEDGCTQFADFFSNKIKRLLITLDGESICTEDTSLCTEPLLAFRECNVKEVVQLIKATSKTCALDPLPSSVLSQCVDALAPLITNIINMSIAQSDIPELLKESVPKISAYSWWNCQATHNRLQIEINYYPDSLLFVSAGFLPRVSSQRLN